MNKLALTLTGVVLLAGCGSHQDAPKTAAQAKPTSARSTCDPGDDSCIPPASPTASTPVEVPVLNAGKPFRYQTGGDAGAVTQEITLLKVKTATSIPYPDGDYTAKPDAGHLFLCVEVRIRNVGTTPGDTYTAAQWFGLDGKVEEPELAAGGSCKPFGMSDDLDGQPNPQPGKYVTGSTLYELSDAPGALEITDSEDTPLFRINYGPKSEQVVIDARGQ